MKKVYYLLKAMRPRQWVKNGFILIPLLFARKVFDLPSLLDAIQAVLVFCLVSGAIYLLNDLFDVAADRMHPVKKFRPLAAGLISPRLTQVAIGLLLVAGVLWSWQIGSGFLIVVTIYIIVQILYNFKLKEVVIMDVFCVSAGFFLRVIAGAAAIEVAVSHWLVVCTILLSMFLALAKRRHELVLMGNGEAKEHRKVLSHYSPDLLDQMVSVITAGTLVSYMLYCVSSETIEKFNTDHLIYTFPFVLYGIFRYLYIMHKKNGGGSPEKILITDKPMLLNVLLWAISSGLIIYGVL